MAADAQATLNSDPTLQDLKPIAKRLNAVSDDLTAALDTIQQHLNELALGVEVWLVWRQDQSLTEIKTDEGYTAEELGYGRIGDGWGLVVRTIQYVFVPSADPNWDNSYWEPVDDVEQKPLLKASRALRVAAVPKIPLLIRAMHEAAAAVIEAVEAAKVLANSLK